MAAKEESKSGLYRLAGETNAGLRILTRVRTRLLTVEWRERQKGNELRSLTVALDIIEECRMKITGKLVV